MYFKLSLKNVGKSFKDYTLYFLTLSFSVCIFYIFNSIEAQKAMMAVSESTNAFMQTITKVMGAISVFVSIILAFLIVYANNFLIRRRKKELGIYMTLGMEKGKMARMLVAETFLIGVLSLGSGLLMGIFLSQGLSVITAKLFAVDMTGYRFIFSAEAFLKTILYFSIIFILVMILSTVSISKYKLIDLINADKQNEKPRLRNPLLTVILFILSIVCLGIAYTMVLKTGIAVFDNRLVIEIVLGAAGTFLFFASLSGFFLKLLQSNKKSYLKGLNMFILRQINSRINTAHISMSFVCLMLFCTIGILSTGLGANSAMNSAYRFSAPFDASFVASGDVDIAGKFEEYDFDLYAYTDYYVQFALYQSTRDNLTKGMIFGKVRELLTDEAQERFSSAPLYMIRLSDFNKLMKLQGVDEIVLDENQIGIYSDYAEQVGDLKNALLKYIDMKYPVTIGGKDYGAHPKLLTDGIVTSTASDIMLALIVPDDMVEGAKIQETILSFNCKGDRKVMQRKLESDLFAFENKYADKKEEIRVTGATAEVVKTVAAGSKAMISFICIYLGLIFLITSAAVLALQQVSETTDNKRRYEILQKIGAEEKLIHSALFRQIAIYFILPLALACIHSIVGLKVANDVIADMGHLDALGNIIITAVLISLVYGAYFIATYFSSKRIILKNRG